MHGNKVGNVGSTKVVPADAAPPQLLLHHGLRGDASMVHARHPQRCPPAHAVPPGQSVLRGRLWPQDSGQLDTPAHRQPFVACCCHLRQVKDRNTRPARCASAGRGCVCST